jgi:hypothetical protein
MKKNILILIIALVNCQVVLAQFLQKVPYPVSDKTADLLEFDKERPVRYEGVIVGLQNLDYERKEVLFWFPKEYVMDLIKTDNEWYLTNKDEILLHQVGKNEYDYSYLEKKPLNIYRISGHSFLNDTKYFGEEKRKKLWAMERAAYKITQAFEDGDTATLKQYITDETPYIAAVTKPSPEKEKGLTEVVKKAELKKWLDAKAEGNRKRLASRLLSCVNDRVIMNTPDPILPENTIHITEIFFKFENDKTYISRITLHESAREYPKDMMLDYKMPEQPAKKETTKTQQKTTSAKKK